MISAYKISDSTFKVNIPTLMHRFIRLAALVPLLCCAPAQAQLYKWVGPDGKLNYTDTPPPPSAKSSEKKSLNGANTVGANTVEANLPYALAQTVKKNPVTLYTMSDCAPCTQARNLLTTRGIPFSEKTIQTPDDLAQLKKLGGSQLPFLLIGGSSEEGFEASQWHRRLSDAAYPEVSQLPNTYRYLPAEPAAPSAPSATSATSAAKDPAQQTKDKKPSASPIDTLPPPNRPKGAPDFRF